MHTLGSKRQSSAITKYLQFYRILVGSGYGFLATSIYMVEVVGREVRGPVLVFAGVTRSLGSILVYTLGALLPWYNIAYIATVFPVLASLLLINSPESPVYLVSQGRLSEAKKSLQKLHGKDCDYSEDVEHIKAGVKSGSLTKSSLSILMEIHKHPEIYKPFLIIFLLSIVQQFSGATVIRGYVVKIFGSGRFKKWNQ